MADLKVGPPQRAEGASDMRRTGWRTWCPVAAACLALATVGGCRDKFTYDLSWGWPWGKDQHDPKELARYGILPLQRVQDAQALAAQAAKAPPEERERITQELAQRISRELDPIVRMELMKALADQPTPTAKAVLRAGLRDPDANVRVVCCNAWAKHAGPEAAEALAEVVQHDKDRDVRLAAVRVLGEVKDQSTMRGLAMALEDSDIAVQHRAMQSLKAVSGKDYGNDVQKWREYVKGGNPQPPSYSIADRIKGIFY